MPVVCKQQATTTIVVWSSVYISRGLITKVLNAFLSVLATFPLFQFIFAHHRHCHRPSVALSSVRGYDGTHSTYPIVTNF